MSMGMTSYSFEVTSMCRRETDRFLLQGLVNREKTAKHLACQ